MQRENRGVGMEKSDELREARTDRRAGKSKVGSNGHLKWGEERGQRT